MMPAFSKRRSGSPSLQTVRAIASAILGALLLLLLGVLFEHGLHLIRRAPSPLPHTCCSSSGTAAATTANTRR